MPVPFFRLPISAADFRRRFDRASNRAFNDRTCVLPGIANRVDSAPDHLGSRVLNRNGYVADPVHGRL